MRFFRLTALVTSVFALAACDASGLRREAYPDRSFYDFMSADGVTRMTYACKPSASPQQTQARAAQAHRYVDGAIRSATQRITGQDRYSQQAIGANWATQADINTEVSRISRASESEYRCLLFSRKAPSRWGGS